LHLGTQSRFRRDADVTARNFPILEDQQSPDRRDAVTVGKFLVGIHVDFADLEVFRQRFNRRIHRPAWRTPFRPKIDEDRLSGVDHFLPFELMQEHDRSRLKAKSLVHHGNAFNSTCTEFEKAYNREVD